MNAGNTGKRTNLDRVRAMSAEELLALFYDPLVKIRHYSAEEIVSHLHPENCPPDVECGALADGCNWCWVEWLKAEAES